MKFTKSSHQRGRLVGNISSFENIEDYTYKTSESSVSHNETVSISKPSGSQNVDTHFTSGTSESLFKEHQNSHSVRINNLSFHAAREDTEDHIRIHDNLDDGEYDSDDDIHRIKWLKKSKLLLKTKAPEDISEHFDVSLQE